MVFSAALEKKGDDDDPKAVEKRFGRRSVQFLGETVQIIALLWSKETTTSGYLLEKKTLRESSYFFFLEKTLRVGSQRNAFFSITSSWEIDRKVVAQEK